MMDEIIECRYTQLLDEWIPIMNSCFSKLHFDEYGIKLMEFFGNSIDLDEKKNYLLKDKNKVLSKKG